MLEAIGEDVAGRNEHRQHDGFDVADGPGWGVGYQSQEDVIVWAGMDGLIAPEVIEGTFAMVEDLDLWDAFLFGDLPDELLTLIRAAMESGTLPELATTLEPISRGICLEGMDTYVYRTPDYQLAGGQDYHPAWWSAQTIMWTATLDDEAFVFTSYPSDLGGTSGQELAGEWIGSWLPRVTLYENVGVVQYRTMPVPLADDYLSSDHTHAYFPRGRFDEVIQVGGWPFGRKGDGYVALYSEHATSWAEDNDYELIAEGETNTWIVEMGSTEESGSFDAFVAAIAAAAVEVGDPVRYESPSQGLVEVGWEGPMTLAGADADLGPYPRWDNGYAQVEVGGTVTRIDREDLRLVLDFDAGERHLLVKEPATE
jgi:hypothetical protein